MAKCPITHSHISISLIFSAIKPYINENSQEEMKSTWKIKIITIIDSQMRRWATNRGAFRLRRRDPTLTSTPLPLGHFGSTSASWASGHPLDLVFWIRRSLFQKKTTAVFQSRKEGFGSGDDICFLCSDATLFPALSFSLFFAILMLVWLEWRNHPSGPKWTT